MPFVLFFFNVLRVFGGGDAGVVGVQKIYRIGLSEAPLPIERYISNFVCEVPLPPQGQVMYTYL